MAISDMKVTVAIAILETDTVKAPVAVERSAIKPFDNWEAAGIPEQATIVVFCPPGTGADVERRIRLEWEASGVLREMVPKGTAS